MGVPASRLSTGLLEDPHNIAAFVAFLVARQVQSTTIVGHVGALRRVVCWRASKGMSDAAYGRLQAVIKWIDTLQRQCSNVGLPSQSPLQRTKLPHAREVLRWQLRMEAALDSLLAEDIERHGRMTRMATIKASQDVAFCELAFGHLPTPRLSCIRCVFQ